MSITDLVPNELISTYGYWAVAVVVGLESMGLPLPGETILIAAATWGGATHHLSMPLVIAAAIAGAVIGDSAGFWVGREVGLRLLLRYGKHVGLNETRLKVGQYLFMRHGGKVVFFGRFTAILRALAAFLAGANRMSWPRFLVFNVSGAIIWASLFGVGAYMFGSAIDRIAGPAGIALLAVGAVAVVAGLWFAHHHHKRIAEEAERALPGPLRH